MDITKINKAGLIPKDKNLCDLKIGQKYSILGLKFIDTKFGKSLVATIENYNDAEDIWSVFLPRRFVDKISPLEAQQLVENNTAIVCLAIQYIPGLPNPTYDIKFEPKKMDSNKYATKTNVLNILDGTLVSANLYRLKRIIQKGTKHDFFTLTITLIAISIVLEVIRSFIFVYGTGVKHTRLTNKILIILNVVLNVVNLAIGIFEKEENSGGHAEDVAARTDL